jgi:hypothetical protein
MFWISCLENMGSSVMVSGELLQFFTVFSQAKNVNPLAIITAMPMAMAVNKKFRFINMFFLI